MFLLTFIKTSKDLSELLASVLRISQFFSKLLSQDLSSYFSFSLITAFRCAIFLRIYSWSRLFSYTHSLDNLLACSRPEAI